MTETLAKGAIYHPIETADRVWARGMARGYRFFAWYLLAELGLSLVMWVGFGSFAALFHTVGSSWTASDSVPAPYGILLQMGCVVALLLRVGVACFGLYVLWGATEAEPDRPRVPLWDKWRQWGRVAFFVIAALTGLEAIGWMSFGLMVPQMTVDDVAKIPFASILMGGVQSYCWLLGGYAVVQGGVELAGRVKSDVLKGDAALVKLFYQIYCGAMFLTLLFFCSCCFYMVGCMFSPVVFVLWVTYVVLAVRAYPQIAAAIEGRLDKAESM